MNTCNHQFGFFQALLLFSAFTACLGGSTDNSTLQLAITLGADGKHQAAAIEYRRLALMEEQRENQAGYYWMAAYEYFKSGEHTLVQRMLDKSENSASNIVTETMLLRAESAIATRKFTEAGFYLENIIARYGSETNVVINPGPQAKALNTATRDLAQVLLSQGKPGDAMNVLTNSPTPCPAAVRALKTYQAGSNRNPKLGGVLGLIPGLGYAYSGEYANALRSLFLNGLFIYAMTDTADREQWGAFAAVTFFELTWYSGSIYGGIDAAERFNQDRLSTCVESIRDRSGFAPDTGRLPVISLQFDF